MALRISWPREHKKFSLRALTAEHISTNSEAKRNILQNDAATHYRPAASTFRDHGSRLIQMTSVQASSSHLYLLQLQREYGNRHVQQLVRSAQEQAVRSEVAPAKKAANRGIGECSADGVTVQRKCDCGGLADSGSECKACAQAKLARARGVQRVLSDASGRKTFECPDYAGDVKLEACLNDRDRLGPGERGPSVSRVQNGLLKDGVDLGKDGADGVYGPSTAKAVVAFKVKHHLGFEQFPDVGPGTMAKLDELCASHPNPIPPPAPTPVKPTQCFDTIDWDAFFVKQEQDCSVAQSSIDAVCALAPNSPFNLGPDPCPKTPFDQRVEDCVADAGFFELAETCGIPGSGGLGKAEIRKRFKNRRKN